MQFGMILLAQCHHLFAYRDNRGALSLFSGKFISGSGINQRCVKRL